MPKILRKKKSDMIITRPKTKTNNYESIAIVSKSKMNKQYGRKSLLDSKNGCFDKVLSKFMGRPRKNVDTLAIHNRMAPWEFYQTFV